MDHCGYDPSGALGTNFKRGDNWKNFKYNFWPKPPRYAHGHEINAFNGASIGKGHLAEAKAAINTGLAGARSAFARGGNGPQGEEPFSSSAASIALQKTSQHTNPLEKGNHSSGLAE